MLGRASIPREVARRSQVRRIRVPADLALDSAILERAQQPNFLDVRSSSHARASGARGITIELSTALVFCLKPNGNARRRSLGGQSGGGRSR